MTGAVATMAERIEAGIVERTGKRVDDAFAQARDVAFKAYAAAFRPVCGIPFEITIAEAMSKVEEALRAQAIAHATRIETETVLRRLGAP